MQVILIFKLSYMYRERKNAYGIKIISLSLVIVPFTRAIFQYTF